MKKSFLILMLIVTGWVTPAWAQVPPEPVQDQLALLHSDDPQLAANKKLVFDFWRIVFEAGHMDQAERYMTAEYIQHNPNLPSGRDTFVEFFNKVREPQPVQPLIKQPLVALTAEGDLVTMAFRREVAHPSGDGSTYFMTWFDMFRIEDGRIAEHWDSSPLWQDGKPLGAEFLPK